MRFSLNQNDVLATELSDMPSIHPSSTILCSICSWVPNTTKYQSNNKDKEQKFIKRVKIIKRVWTAHYMDTHGGKLKVTCDIGGVII